MTSIREVKKWAIVNKINPKLEVNNIFDSRDDVVLEEDEKWIQVIIKQA